jgi:hypothetical protein
MKTSDSIEIAPSVSSFETDPAAVRSFTESVPLLPVRRALTSVAFAAGAVKRGFDRVMPTSDLSCMIAGARVQLDELKTKTA